MDVKPRILYISSASPVKGPGAIGWEHVTKLKQAGYKILEIQFSSNEFESKNMIDFLNKYGKIIYKDSEGEECELKFTNAVGKKYLGKVLYLKVPKDFETSTDARFVFIVRNKKYEIKL